MATVTFWTGDPGRELQARRPCECGCDERDGPVIGYLTASDEDGRGVTIIAESETEYAAMAALAV